MFGYWRNWRRSVDGELNTLREQVQQLKKSLLSTEKEYFNLSKRVDDASAAGRAAHQEIAEDIEALRAHDKAVYEYLCRLHLWHKSKDAKGTYQAKVGSPGEREL